MTLGWLFTDKGTVSFTFLGRIRVTYHNPKKKNIFPGKIKSKFIRLEAAEGKVIEVSGTRIGEPWASRIRAREVKRINVYYE